MCLWFISVSLDFFSDVFADFLMVMVGSLGGLKSSGLGRNSSPVFRIDYFIAADFGAGDASKCSISGLPEHFSS